MKAHAILSAALVVSLTACASPLAVPKLPSFQAKATQNADWSELAYRTAGRFVRWLGATPSAVYIAPGPSDMPFAAAYRNALEQELHQRGIRVQETASDATVLRFDVQTFWYKDQHQKWPVEYGTFWTTAAALGAQARDISRVDTSMAVAGGAGPVMDILMAMFDTTNAEVALTVTVYDGSRLAYRDGETLYIRPTELPFYWSKMPDFVPQAKQHAPEDVVLPVRAARF